MNRVVALTWAAAALVMGFWSISIALGPKADASGWLMALAFAVAAAVCVWRAWREWQTPDVTASDLFPPPAPREQNAAAADAPRAGRGPPIPLETQISQLHDAGLVMAPGRTIAELLTSWARADYESDPYLLLLVMFGSEVEAEPWGRFFCERGLNFDMECLVQRGDYVLAFTEVLRITGQPGLATLLSDDFDIDGKSAMITYTMKDSARTITARVDNDWADPAALAAFMHDIETTIADGRHFWAADNGQSAVLFFLTDPEAARINALRDQLLQRYTA
jgi:hypothetical protein